MPAKRLTEKTWFAATDPQAMLRFLGRRASDRKLRLFGCACCRRAWGFAKGKRFHEALLLIEGFADGTVKDRDRGRAHQIGSQLHLSSSGNPEGCLGAELWEAARKTLDRDECDFGESAAAAFGWAAGNGPVFFAAKEEERAQQTLLVHDMFGNPFRRVKLNLAWRTSDVILLAKGIYAERAFDRMPILADALQDAGCDSDDLLNHLRDTSATHVRGCWALDLVLGKE
jgi:hypothetical protein